MCRLDDDASTTLLACTSSFSMASHLSTTVPTTEVASAPAADAAFLAVADSFCAASDRFTAVGRLQKALQTVIVSSKKLKDVNMRSSIHASCVLRRASLCRRAGSPRHQIVQLLLDMLRCCIGRSKLTTSARRDKIRRQGQSCRNSNGRRSSDRHIFNG